MESKVKKLNHAVFVNGQPNQKDWLYVIGFFILLSLPFIFNFLQSSSIKSYGNIYLPIFILTFAGIGFALLARNRFTGEVIYGKINSDKTLYLTIAVGAVFGFALISSLFIGSNFLSFFQVPLPYSISPIPSSTTSGDLALLVVISIFAVETEESLRATFLVPTFTKLRLPIILFFAGIITLALPQLYILTILLFVSGLLFIFDKRLSNITLNNGVSRHITAILVAAVIFGLFHIYSYSTVPGNEFALLESAMAFAFGADIINWVMQSTISSRIAHSINNSFIYASETGIALPLAAFVVIIYAIIIVIIYQSKKLMSSKVNV
jgi:hypothetical protein